MLASLALCACDNKDSKATDKKSASGKPAGNQPANAAGEKPNSPADAAAGQPAEQTRKAKPTIKPEKFDLSPYETAGKKGIAVAKPFPKALRGTSCQNWVELELQGAQLLNQGALQKEKNEQSKWDYSLVEHCYVKPLEDGSYKLKPSEHLVKQKGNAAYQQQEYRLLEKELLYSDKGAAFADPSNDLALNNALEQHKNYLLNYIPALEGWEGRGLMLQDKMKWKDAWPAWTPHLAGGVGIFQLLGIQTVDNQRCAHIKVDQWIGELPGNLFGVSNGNVSYVASGEMWVSLALGVCLKCNLSGAVSIDGVHNGVKMKAQGKLNYSSGSIFYNFPKTADSSQALPATPAGAVKQPAAKPQAESAAQAAAKPQVAGSAQAATKTQAESNQPPAAKPQAGGTGQAPAKTQAESAAQPAPAAQPSAGGKQ